MVKDPSQHLSLPPDKGRAVKIGEASRILGIHTDTLRRWEKRGKITPVRTPGGTRLYYLDELRSLNPKVLDNFSQPPSTEQLFAKNLYRIDEEGVKARNEEIHADPDLKPLQRIPEFLGLVVIFFLLLAIGITNITASTNKSPFPSLPYLAPSPVVLGEINEATSEATAAASPESSPKSASEATPEAKPKKIVTVKIEDGSSGVNIRQKPTTSSRKIGQARDGDTFEFLFLDLGWYEIKLSDGSTGFISATYIKTGEINN